MARTRSSGRHPRRPRQARSRFLFDAVVEATGDVLVEKGVDAITTTRVAERAGVSIGSLYQYFPDRQALVQEFVRARFDADAALMQGIVSAGARAPIRTVVRAAIEGLVATYRREQALYREVMAILPGLDHTEEMQAISSRTLAFGAMWLRGRPEPELRDRAELGAALLFFGIRSALNGLVRQHPESLDDASLVDRLVMASLAFLGMTPGE
jgi:AcrR family transcriptional regulator